MADKSADNAQEITTILAYMEDGQSLRSACASTGVSVTVFLRWVDSDKELQEQYARARARLLDFKAEELEDIGDQAANAETAVQVAGLRLKSDNRKWLLSKLAPKKYGDKLELAGDAANPLTISVSAATMTDDQLAAIVASRGTK